MATDRYLVIHGHFYQPPRENPWILTIAPQPSAAPFTNWNQRINRECYAPNTLSRLLNKNQGIIRLINNYRHLSFNFGPTLLLWLEKEDPETYARIVKADRQGAAACGGHGPALAQVYNHLIMPLANRRDRLTQIRWGVNDFKECFGRQPEGLWLSETAVDLETVELLAREGLKFTVLAQGQAARVRPLGPGGERLRGAEGWENVEGGRIDPREPYRVFWGSGPKDYLDIFFYDGPVSRAIAFEKLLRDGGTFLQRIEQAFGNSRVDKSPRLVSLATDGESYGHHFFCGDMALAWLFNKLEEESGQEGAIRLTNYGQFLELFPPRREVEIIDNTSWSCAHGVERWRSDCGCTTGGGGGGVVWNQRWRKPLREGFDWLRDQLVTIYEKEMSSLVKDPWVAREDYLKVVRSGFDPEVRRVFLATHQLRELTEAESSQALRLFESQLMSLYMFTSCAWFFDDIVGIEPVQNLSYALKAMDLVQPWSDTDLQAGFLAYLKDIRPNQSSEYPTGLEVWEKLVLPARQSGHILAAQWASSFLVETPEVLELFASPTFKVEQAVRFESGEMVIMAGLVELGFNSTGRVNRYLCLGLSGPGGEEGILIDHAPQQNPPWLEKTGLRSALGHDLESLDTLNIWDKMAQLMPEASSYTIKDFPAAARSLFLKTKVEDIYHKIHDHIIETFLSNQHLLMLNRSAGLPLHWLERVIFRVMSEHAVKHILAPAGSDQSVDIPALARIFDRQGLVGLAKDETTSAAHWSCVYLNQTMTRLARDPDPLALLDEIIRVLTLIQETGLEVDKWESQNMWYVLNSDKAWLSRLTPREVRLMSQLGLQLGFSESHGRIQGDWNCPEGRSPLVPGQTVER